MGGLVAGSRTDVGNNAASSTTSKHVWRTDGSCGHCGLNANQLAQQLEAVDKAVGIGTINIAEHISPHNHGLLHE